MGLSLSGNVFGPSGVVIDNSVVRWDSTTGRIIQGGYTGGLEPTISDAGLLSTPGGAALSVATATSINKVAITAPATSSTLTIDDGFTLRATGNVTALSGSHTGSSSGTNTGDQTSVSGNAGTATALQNARTIGGVSFDGTANITVATATAGFTVSGGALALGANSITMSGSIGVTGTRVTKGWFTDLESTNAMVGSVTGNAATVTTNANLTGPITSSGNITSVAAQTGTGTTFVMATAPTVSALTVSALTADRAVFAGAAGLLKDYAAVAYNATGVFSGPGFMLTIPQRWDYTRTGTTTGSFSLVNAVVTVTPGGAGGVDTSMTVYKASLEKIDSNTWFALTGGDFYVKNSGTGTVTAMVGSDHWAHNLGAATVTNMYGSIHLVTMTHASAVSGTMTACRIDPNNGSITPQEGANTTFNGLEIVDGSMDLNTMTCVNRRGIYIGTMAGTPSTTDFAFYSVATQPSRFTGKIGIGKTPAAQFDITTTSPGSITDSTGTAYSTSMAGLITLTAKAANNNLAGLFFEVISNTTTIAAGAYILSGVNANVLVPVTDSAVYPAGSALIGGSYVASYGGTTSGVMPNVIGVKAVVLHRADPGGTGGTISTVMACLQTEIYQLENTGTHPLVVGAHFKRPLTTNGSVITDMAGVYIENQSPSATTVGSVVTSSAILIAAQTKAAGTVTAYAINQIGTADNNFFGGFIGIGVATPTARLHLPAGTATAGTGPFQFTSGTHLTTPINGMMEYNGTNLFFTRAGAVREGVLMASAKTTEVVVTDTTVTINIDGVTLKLLARA